MIPFNYFSSFFKTLSDIIINLFFSSQLFSSSFLYQLFSQNQPICFESNIIYFHFCIYSFSHVILSICISITSVIISNLLYFLFILNLFSKCVYHFHSLKNEIKYKYNHHHILQIHRLRHHIPDTLHFLSYILLIE